MGNFDLEYVSVPGKNRILGLAFPMRTDGVGGFLTSNENLGSLRDCVIQLIMTRRGARVMRPDFGTAGLTSCRHFKIPNILHYS